MQETLDGKPLTKLLRLQLLRTRYYSQYIDDIQSHIIFLRQRTEQYKQTVKSLDEEIGKEKRKQQKNV